MSINRSPVEIKQTNKKSKEEGENVDEKCGGSSGGVQYLPQTPWVVVSEINVQRPSQIMGENVTIQRPRGPLL